MITDTLKQLIDTINKMAPEVWNIYVRQSLITGWTMLAVGLILILSPTPLFIWLKRTWQDRDEAKEIIPTVGGILIVLGLLLIIAIAIPYLLNPSYYAIQNLLSILRGG